MSIPSYETIIIPESEEQEYASEILKMEHALNCTDEYYLLWDEDTQPCHTVSMFTKEGKPILDIRKELREGLFEMMSLLVPGIRKRIEKSFICEHQLVKTEYMKELIGIIEENKEIPGNSYSEKIAHILDDDPHASFGFNAYELYGNYILWRHSDSYRFREWSTFRLGADFYEKESFTEADAAWLSRDFDAISFLRGHSIREDHRDLFNNPRYQAKLTPRQMLDAVQGEYRDEQSPGWEGTAEELMKAYHEQQEAEYRLYERMGDERKSSNPAQAFLCYQQAEFLCTEAEKREELSVKRASLKSGVPSVAIIIVSYNSRQLMEDCINSIRCHCPEGSYSIIVVDNASKDGVKDYLQQQEDITLICNEENRGFPVACNQGIAAAPAGEDIFFLNNDTRITHNALFWLRMGLYESGDTGASGCVANYAGTGQMLELMLPSAENYTAYAREKNIPLPDPYEDAKILCGFAMLVRRSFIDEYGGMDEAFSPGYYEDTDLSLRIRQSGKRLRICRNSFIYHAGGKSFKERPDLDAITDRNLLLLASRWGTDFMK